MKRLTALNLLLVVLIAAGGWRLYARAQQRAAAEQQFLSRSVEAAPAPLLALPEKPEPARPLDYFEIAAQLPFHPERNPEVIVEAPAPKPRPALPRYYGVMNFGGPPRVVLAVAAGQQQKSYQVGDRVGDFTLQAIASEGLTFDWEGETVTTPYHAIRDNTPPPAPAGNSKPAAEKSQPKPAAAKTVSADAAKGPGLDLGGNFKGCVEGDSTPSGTVVGGYRKLVTETPFGKSCRWEKVE